MSTLHSHYVWCTCVRARTFVCVWELKSSQHYRRDFSFSFSMQPTFFFSHTKRRSRQHYRRHFPKFSPHVQVAICFHPLFLFTSSFSSAFSCIFPSASFRLLCLRILYRRILSLLYVSFAKETYSFKEPTNHMCVLYPARSWPPPPKKHTTRHTHVVSCTHIEENIVSFIGFFCKRDL